MAIAMDVARENQILLEMPEANGSPRLVFQF
jgi:hypothetical protein